MGNDAKIKKIKALISEQMFFVLCTYEEKQAYGSLIAYAFTEDLSNFYFATSEYTRKYKFLKQNPGIAIVIDNRCSNEGKLMEIDVLTITGNAYQISEDKEEFKTGIDLLDMRHHNLSDFFKLDSTALFKINTEKFFYVTSFQNVFKWEPF